MTYRKTLPLSRGFITQFSYWSRQQSSHPAPRRALVLFLASGLFLFGTFLIFLLAVCRNPPASAPESQTAAPRGSLELVFPYGSEKEKWINDVTAAFNRSNTRTQSGKTIFVRAMPMGSGETIDNILSGPLQAHLASPASAEFITLGNAESPASGCFASTGIDRAGNPSVRSPSTRKKSESRKPRFLRTSFNSLGWEVILPARETRRQATKSFGRASPVSQILN